MHRTLSLHTMNWSAQSPISDFSLQRGGYMPVKLLGDLFYFYIPIYITRTHREIIISHLLRRNWLLKMNRIALNAVVRAARINPTIRSAAPYRWVSLQISLNIFIWTFTISYFSNPAILLVVNKHKDLHLLLVLQVVLQFFSEVCAFLWVTRHNTWLRFFRPYHSTYEQ